MVYDWEAHKETCRRLYVEEKKPTEEIMQYMKDNHGFVPSKRAYQTQFRRWDFPSKYQPALKNEPLVLRVKELWERNLSQAEMLRVLTEEDGFNIKNRELVRVRTQNRWLLRIPTSGKDEQTQGADDGSPGGGGGGGAAGFMNNHAPGSQLQSVVQGFGPVDDSLLSPELNPDLDSGSAAQRQEKKRRMEAESAERYATRKRRRRTRAWAGMPADPPAPPRFPSETTLSESLVYLDLSKENYTAVREIFQSICEEAGILKKTVAGPERWESAKERLINETPHLQSVMRVNTENIESKKLALDVICCDVTKRMRSGGEKPLLLADAKNILGLNPEESREVRSAFYRLLKADDFTSKIVMGKDRWEELKQKWIDGSESLQKMLARLDNNHSHEMKTKAIEALARDVRKRLRDDQTRRVNNKKTQDASKSNLEDAEFEDDPELDAMGDGANAFVQMEDNGQLSLIPDEVDQGGNSQARLLPDSMILPQTELPIDSQLLLSAHPQNGYVDQQHFTHFDPTSAAPVFQPQPSNPIAIYLRVDQASTYAVAPGLWIGVLNSPTLDELKQVAVEKFPGAICLRVDGICQDARGEASIEIKNDMQLAAYLTHGQEGPPLFSVQLLHVWKGN